MKRKMKFIKSIIRPITISRDVQAQKLLLIQPSTDSPLPMQQRLRSDTALSHPTLFSGSQYSPLRFEELIPAPPLAMHLKFKSHLPSTLSGGVGPWRTRSPSMRSIPSESWYLKHPHVHDFRNCDS